MKSSPCVTIITPSFNQGAFLATTLESVAGQSYPHKEHIVVDPGSTDESLTIIRKWLSEGNNRRALLGLDKSQTNAINLGVENASGNILCWLNSDDCYFDESVLEEVAGIFAREPGVDVVYGRGWFVDPGGAKLKDAYINVDDRDLEPSFLTSIGILQPATFVRKEAWLRAGPVDENMQFSFDYEFWVRLLKTGSLFRFLDRNLAKAIIHTDAKTMAGRLQSLEECVQTTVRHYGFAPKEWLQRLADKELNDNDGILKSADENNPALQVATEQKFLMRNADNTSAGRLLSLAHLKQATGSLASWRGNRVAPLHIVTCFDAPYFHSGLTLLSQLCRHGHADTPKYVFDLGLTPEQRKLLDRVKNTYVLSFDAYRKSYQDWYFDPKSYVYKILALHHLMHVARAGEIVLWIDAGVAPIADLEPVVRTIERDGVLFVDHDDRPGWPFYNVCFTSDAFIRKVKPSLKAMLAPHLCSCVMGYKRSHNQEQLFKEALVLSLDPEISLGDKHPQDPVKKHGSSTTEKHAFQKMWQDSSQSACDRLAELRRIYGYLGHRQDQSIFSYLAAKYGVKLQSTKEFCLGSDHSSKLSKENWDCKGFNKDLVLQVGRFEQYAPAITAHHRGSVISYADLIFEPPEAGDLILFGTYADTEAVKRLSAGAYHTMALNLGYRRWQSLRKSPDFFACCTSAKVLAECQQSITNYIHGEVECGSETVFAVGDTLLDKLDSKSRARCLNIDALARGFSKAANVTDPFVRLLLCCQLLGYKQIHLVGFDHLFSTEEKGGLLDAMHHACIGDAVNHSDGKTVIFHRSEALRRNSYRFRQTFPQDCYTTSEELSRSLPRRESPQSAPATDVLPAAQTDLLLGPYSREQSAHFDETDAVAAFLDRKVKTGTMIDVGAHHGYALAHFLEKGWKVWAFEPDATNRATLEALLSARPNASNVTLDTRCVSNKSASNLPFYQSDESTGISGLSAFRNSHREAQRVDSVSLSDFFKGHEMPEVAFLKVDTEGHDLFVLQGFPWERNRPKVIECEFEDLKTKPLGYTTKDMADFLVGKGYTVYVSEWHPILRYGQRHDWHRLQRYPCELACADAWGNLLAFHHAPNANELVSAFRSVLTLHGCVGASSELSAATHQQFFPMIRDSLRSLKQHDISLAAANRSLRQGSAVKALAIYLTLHKTTPFAVYANNAVFAANRLGLRDVRSIKELEMLSCP
jgi:FkbM family methyltransferase